MASVLFRNLSHQIDRLMMPRLLSVTALGSYNRPKDFVGQMSDKLCGIFDKALFPVLSGIQDDVKVLNSAFRRSMYVMNMFALLLAMAFMFNNELLIRIFFGEQWIHLRSVMFVVSFSVVFNFDGRLADCFLRSLAMIKQQFFFRVFEMTINIIGVIVGYRWDILGVAVSLVVTNGIAKLIKIVYTGVKVDLKPTQIVNIMLSSWRYAILLFPVYMLTYNLLPSSWMGNIIMALVFVATTAVVFIYMPRFVGKEYEKEVYAKIHSFVHSNILKRE